MPEAAQRSDNGDELLASELVEWLLNKGQATLLNEYALLVAEAAGQEHDPLRKVGPRCRRAYEEGDAVEARHLAVANDDVEALAGSDSLEGEER